MAEKLNFVSLSRHKIHSPLTWLGRYRHNDILGIFRKPYASFHIGSYEGMVSR